METPPLAPEAEKPIKIQTQLLHQANLKLDHHRAPASGHG